jgi:hypothetical protein
MPVAWIVQLLLWIGRHLWHAPPKGSDMAASRGDSKPCTVANCAGKMQFGRRSDNDPPTPVTRRRGDLPAVAMDDKGWVCNANLDHFRQEAS